MLAAQKAAVAKAKKSKDKDDDADDSGSSVSRQKTASPAPSAGSGPAKTKQAVYYSLPFDDSLALLASIYTSTSSTTTTRTKVGVVQTLAYLFMNTPSTVIETKYAIISKVLLVDLLSNTGIRNNKYKSIMAKNHIHFLLDSIISEKILGEFGQISAIKLLVSDILQKYYKTTTPSSSLKDSNDPMKEPLVATLKCIASLIDSLGPAVAAVADLLEGSLLKLLVYPSYSVKVSACLCLKSFVEKSPSHLLPLLMLGLNHINKELGSASPTQSPQPAAVGASNEQPQSLADRVLGHAYMTSVLSGITQKYPQYSSLELAARVFTTATSLLKKGGNVTTVAVQVQVGWLLVSGLMALGPSFVKVHLSQLLLLWKNALHRPVGKEQLADTNNLELNYLLLVRYSALTSISSFLIHNSQLVTPDMAKRIATILENVLSFSSSIPSKKLADDDLSHRLDKSLSLEYCDMMVKRRVYQCYISLSQYDHIDVKQFGNERFNANILTSALSTFADPERSSSAEMSTAIATATGAIESIWEVADNHAFGLTSKINGRNLNDVFFGITSDQSEQKWLSELDWAAKLEVDISKPILDSPEFDADKVLLSDKTILGVALSQSVPVATSIVDFSIDLFVTLLPLQLPKVQESILDQLRTYVLAATATGSQNRKSGRKDAVTVNSIVAVFSALRYSLNGKTSSGQPRREALKATRVLKIFLDIIKFGLRDGNSAIRSVAAQGLGILCFIGSSTMAAEVIKSLIDEIVSNRDPNSRAGNSLALGYILKYVGGMFAGIHLKTILGVLMSLANDPHPTVHFWALESISVTIENTGMSFMGYASSTLSTLNKLYLLESHSDETMSAVSSNLGVELPTTKVIARCVCALITLLGPDLQASQKNMATVLALIRLFEVSEYNSVVLESSRCIQELTIFAPASINIEAYTRRMHSDLMKTDNDLLRDVAIDGLYQLIRTQGNHIFQLAGPGLDKHIWVAFDQSPDNKPLRKFIEYWLDQTGVDRPFDWISRVQAILTKSRTMFVAEQDREDTNQAATNALELGDEEGTSFTVSDSDGAAGSNGKDASFANEPLRWQTRALATECLHKLVQLLLRGKSLQDREKSVIIPRIGDIIKIAFSSSTASVLELRLLGLGLLDEILAELQDVVDPDFREASLLEQYQAQISSALTPAFSADSSPDLAYRAIKVCATFIGSGIIKDVSRMGRILKLLTTALETCSGPQIMLGDLKVPSPNSQVMLRLAILSLWAELQVSSVNPGQEYLVDVVKPYIPTLLPLWIQALRDFARLRFEPVQSTGLSSSSGSLTGSIDQMYSSLSRSSILPTYQQSWLQLVDAIASLIEEDSDNVFTILHEKEKISDNSGGISDDIKYSSEPAAFFFVLFGLCFEALVRPTQSLGTSNSKLATTSDQRLRVLLALKRILHRSVSGVAIYKDEILAETIDVLDRIVLTGALEEQRAVVSIAHGVCLNHPGRAKITAGPEEEEDEIPESVDQLFELFRLAMLPITTMFPALSDSETAQDKFVETPVTAGFIKDCVESLVDMIQVFPKVIKVDLYACLLYVFEKLLEDDRCQSLVIPGLLVVHKRLLQMMMKTRESSIDDEQVIDQAVVTAFSKIISLLKNTKDTTDGALARRRNCLLSAVVIITVCKDSLQSETSSLTDLGELLAENLSIPSLSATVSSCAKTVLVATVNTRAGKVLSESAFPPLISLITSGHGFEEEDKPAEVYIISKLVNDVLAGFVLALTGSQGK
ncbi:Laa1p [Sugiyamaella lignohabitans]|uniref:Laa1p n=1 Tax=Sugiyamaella lignohabitans TaxID=796027 RepID=A0A167FA22_9ASCO|nr:Laa1p [Sugiyamaella lignohabitans]ANB15018.1 Laa1p [Sugiyamaella lignohabitans]